MLDDLRTGRLGAFIVGQIVGAALILIGVVAGRAL